MPAQCYRPGNHPMPFYDSPQFLTLQVPAPVQETVNRGPILCHRRKNCQIERVAQGQVWRLECQNPAGALKQSSNHFKQDPLPVGSGFVPLGVDHCAFVPPTLDFSTEIKHGRNKVILDPLGHRKLFLSLGIDLFASRDLPIFKILLAFPLKQVLWPLRICIRPIVFVDAGLAILPRLGHPSAAMECNLFAVAAPSKVIFLRQESNCANHQ